MSSAKPRLLIITNLYPVPWAPTRAAFNKQQFDLLAQHYQIKIIVLLPWLEWLSHKSECIESEFLSYCPYFYLPKLARTWVPKFQYWALKKFTNKVKQFAPDHILASWGFPDAVSVAMFAQKLNVPFSVKVHGTDVNGNTLHTKRTKMMVKYLSKASTIFCASRALSDKLAEIGLSKQQLVVNYNGVNKQIFYPSVELTAQPRLVFVGSLIKTKGVIELIEAITQVKQQVPDIKCDIIGYGSLTAKLTSLIKQHQLQKQVHLLGAMPLTQVAEKVRDARVVVLPSYREGVPNVLLEAFASGVPVVATNVGGIPEIVSEQTGLLTEAKQVNDLAHTIRQALDKAWQQSEILAHADKFDWNNNVELVIKHLNKRDLTTC